jgi:hypothetical protein
MRLNSQSSQFVFNLPSDFIRPDIIAAYQPILEKNWVQYENVVDYLSSTIKGINFPGISLELPKQLLPRGKERQYKPAKNVQDITTTHDLNVTFRSVDSDLNYWLLFDIITQHYLDLENEYVAPFTMTCLDAHRDAIYVVRFYEIIIKNMQEINFNYSQQKVPSKEFTITFHFNFYEVEFLLNQRKLLVDNDGSPEILDYGREDNFLVGHWRKSRS